VTDEASGLTAALMQLAQLAERVIGLDTREAGHAKDIREGLAQLTTVVNAMKGTQENHKELLRSLEGLPDAVYTLADRLNEIAPEDDDPKFYVPQPSPRFWKLEGEARDQAVERLRAWVGQVYRPGYGWLSAQLADCWPEHPICLYALDLLSEIWSVLYLNEKRTALTLAGQADLQTRVMPAIAEQLARETRSCTHAPGRNGHPVGAWS
jgi:hypothetical protein